MNNLHTLKRRSLSTKPLSRLVSAIACFLFLPLLTAGCANFPNTRSIFPDSPELSNPLNTAFNYTITSSLVGAGEVLSRIGSYTYRPAVVKISNQQLYMWFCSGDGHGDGIYFASSDNSGQTWSSSVEVVKSSSTRSDYLDSAHACDPSVTTDGSYFYVFYSGAPDWGPNTCTGYGFAEGSCDNRIFVARVPTDSPSVPTSYQKLVDVGECPQGGCFQYQPFWGPGAPNGTPDYYPPVPVVRNEIGTVWRRAGTGGKTGTTTQQTHDYGIGQPSVLNVWAIRIWFTWQSKDSTPSKSAEYVQWRPYQDLSNPYWLQDQASYTRRVSNTNDVDYSVAFDSTRNRYIATIARSPYQPCVNYAIKTGFDTSIPSHADPNNPDATNDEIITRNLLGDMNAGGDGTDGCLASAGTNAHNDGLVRDANGYLVTVPDPSGNNVYWVYYADNHNLTSDNWHIARISFTVQ